MTTPSPAQLLWRIRMLTALFIGGLVISGLTAIPLLTEVTWLWEQSLPGCATPCVEHMSAFGNYMETVVLALSDTQRKYPFLFYGTDWLAFGHIVIAIAFVGAWRDPVRNRWLFDFGLIACALVIPWALVFGGVRGIPVWWRLIDCFFGVSGAVPLWLCRKWVGQMIGNGEIVRSPEPCRSPSDPS